MAVSYIARKCTQCAGRLQYVKEKKLWKCLYCGAEIERETQYDGQFTIKNVVRQALLDVSYRRLEGAAKNITECEKIDSRYVGTLIARIAYSMITAITPNACQEHERKNLIAVLKRDYEALQAIGKQMTDEEEALYEFIDAHDAFATLVLVYDSLNDTVRRDFVAGLLNVGEIYSREANKNLLGYSLKRGLAAMTDGIIANSRNIDVKFALAQMLEQYPDGDGKVANVEKLLAAQPIGPEDKGIFEQYLNASADSPGTKSKAAALALSAGIRIGLEILIRQVLIKADASTVGLVLNAYCGEKLNDDAVHRIIEFAFAAPSVDVALTALDGLQTTNQFVLMPQRFVLSMLSRGDLDAGAKQAILIKALAFKMDAKGREAVVTSYLCQNGASPEERRAIIAVLLGAVSTLPTMTVESYVMKVTVDGANKAAIVRQIFQLELNMSFFNQLLAKYMNHCPDGAAVKKDIVALLSAKGLKVDPRSFIEYICGSQDEAAEKLQFVKSIIADDAPLRSDTANAYLEGSAPERFDPELFRLVLHDSSTFDLEGLTNYLLHFKDKESARMSHAAIVLERFTGSAGGVSCSIHHLGNSVSCNLVQAYTLLCSDSLPVGQEIVALLTDRYKVRLNADIVVSGQRMKFKRYAVSSKEQFSETTRALCEHNKVYSLFF